MTCPIYFIGSKKHYKRLCQLLPKRIVKRVTMPEHIGLNLDQGVIWYTGWVNRKDPFAHRLGVLYEFTQKRGIPFVRDYMQHYMARTVAVGSKHFRKLIEAEQLYKAHRLIDHTLIVDLYNDETAPPE